MNRYQKEMVITHIAAIIAVNVVFLYLRHLNPDDRASITAMHFIFGTMQVVTLVPKIIGNLKSSNS